MSRAPSPRFRRRWRGLALRLGGSLALCCPLSHPAVSHRPRCPTVPALSHRARAGSSCRAGPGRRRRKSGGSAREASETLTVSGVSASDLRVLGPRNCQGLTLAPQLTSGWLGSRCCGPPTPKAHLAVCGNYPGCPKSAAAMLSVRLQVPPLEGRHFHFDAQRALARGQAPPGSAR
jgi:hypothetical protein